MRNLDFPAWLREQLNNKKWRPTDLAKKTLLSDAAISRILKGERNPDTDTLLAIARALNIPIEEIFQAAGLLPLHPKHNGIINRLLYLVETLPPQDQEEVLQYALMRQSIAERKNETKLHVKKSSVAIR